MKASRTNDHKKKQPKTGTKKAKKPVKSRGAEDVAKKQASKLSQEGLKAAAAVPVQPQNDTPQLSYRELLAKLPPRYARFVEEYLIDLIESKAVIRAGYSPKGSQKAAWRLLHNANVLTAIQAGKEEISKRLDISQERVVEELALIGFSDMKDFITIDSGGGIMALPLESLPEGKSRIVRKVKEKRTIRTTKGTESKPDGEEILESTYEFELCDKVKSLELLARHLGILHDKAEITGKDGGPIRTTDVTDEELLIIARGGRTGAPPKAKSPGKPA